MPSAFPTATLLHRSSPCCSSFASLRLPGGLPPVAFFQQQRPRLAQQRLLRVRVASSQQQPSQRPSWSGSQQRGSAPPDSSRGGARGSGNEGGGRGESGGGWRGRGGGGDSSSGGGRGRGGGRYGGAPRTGGGPPSAPLVPFEKFSEWWRTNVFVPGLPIGPIAPTKLANGHTARPSTGPSTAGKPIKVETNHLRLDVSRLRNVAQYEVRMTKLPRSPPQPQQPTTAAAAAAAGKGTDEVAGRGEEKSSTGGRSKSGSSRSRGGGGGRSRIQEDVKGEEAHAVLCRLIGTPSASAAWVYDGAAVLYAAVGGGGQPQQQQPQQQQLEGEVRGADEHEGAGGGEGGGGLDQQLDQQLQQQQQVLGLAAADLGNLGGGGGYGGSGGGRRVDVPLEAGGPAAGSSYMVELRRTALIDVQQCLRDQQRRRQQQTAAAAGKDNTQRQQQPGQLAEQQLEESEDWSPAASAASAAASSEAAALAVLELVTRAAVSWDPDTVRTAAGSFVSYRQEDTSSRIGGLLPLKLLRGFRSRVANVAAGLTLTVDAAAAVVAQDGPLLQQIEAALGGGGSRGGRGGGGGGGGGLAQLMQERGNVARLEAALVGLEAKAGHNSITYKLSGRFTAKSAGQHSFPDKATGKTWTVESYFREKYGVRLVRPELPCALDRKGAAVPLELLTVVRSQKRMSRMDAKAKADFIRAAALRPADRLRAAWAATAALLKGPGAAVARGFGLQAAVAFLKVAGRLLPGPLLEVAGGRSGLPAGNTGEWSLTSAGGVAAAGAWRSGVVLSYLDPKKDDAEAAVGKLLSQIGSSLSRLKGAPMPRDMPVVWATSTGSPQQQLPQGQRKSGGGGAGGGGGGGGGSRDPAKAAEAWLREAVRQAEEQYGAAPQLVLVVLPSGRDCGAVYEAIKAAGDGRIGVVTQCIDPGKASLARDGPAPAYGNQIALSINAKLGGITNRPAGRPQDWAPVLRGSRLMVLGADISRGAAAVLGDRGGSGGGSSSSGVAGGDVQVVSPDEELTSRAAGIEYAAVVGSVDSHAVRYSQQLSVQQAGNRDVILGMKDSVEGLLRAYAASLNAPTSSTSSVTQQQRQQSGAPANSSSSGTIRVDLLPEVLLMYRDGVADSMFDAVLVEEHTAIKQACTNVGGPGYNPRVTFVVVQKSHNTRLYPPAGASSPAEVHKSGNVLPGTVVDMEVVEDVAFDFFLNSHAGIQGTNRVPRYTVLVDEVGFTSESLQLLTFALCHTYPACSRSLSLPPAARLAHLAADRGRVALQEEALGHITAVQQQQRRRQQGSQQAAGGGGAGQQQGAVAAPVTTEGWHEMLRSAPLGAHYVL